MNDVAPVSEGVSEPSSDDASIRFLVLGPIRASRDGVDLHVGGTKQRSILAVLIASWGQPISLGRIVDAVYGEDAGETARNSVYTYISTLRKTLGEIVRKEPAGYLLDVDRDDIDANRFESSVQSALSILDQDSEKAASLLRESLAMWRGHAYADVEGHGWFQPEITRLSELRFAALEARIDADLASGRHRELLGELEALTIEYPLREGFRARHMLALYRAGRQTEALRAYQDTRSYLADEIGVEPSPKLRSLEERILDQDPELDLPVVPSLSRRAVVVVDMAEPELLTHLSPSARATVAEEMAREFQHAIDGHSGGHSAQRGSALYAAFPTMRDAVEAIGSLTSPAGSTRLRAAVDFGEVEMHDSGEVIGPPVRRAAGMVATAHPGQVLLSAGAHQALLDEGDQGWTVRSLGSHRINGVDGPQPVFQLVLPGQKDQHPPLLVDAAPPPLPTSRGAVAGYELRRPLYSDLAGTTYRAYQPSVGREVLITVIDPVWANQADFVSRFEVETQLVTRLRHPHIVPILDYWRDPTGAYLVSPSLGDRSLAESLSAGGLGEDQRRRLISQIGGALTQAHQLGVVHGSISPSTVVVDDSGNGYLTGVGFVMRLSGAPAASSPYTAPELERGEPLTAAADVFGLGCLVQTLLEGLAGPSLEAVTRAMAERPEGRFTTMSDFLTELAPTLGEPGRGAVFTPTRNPYKGLEAFAEADSRDFFGRSGAVSDLAARLADSRLVAVVGPSGCGKSSLVEAGLIPLLKKGKAGKQRWVTAVMFPGSYPFMELESALARVAVEDAGDLRAMLEDEGGPVRVVKRVLPPDTRMLLVIDQFEELFTLVRDEGTRNRFLQALVALANDRRSEARVVITLRADFFDRPLLYPEFGELLKAGTFPLSTPGPEELTEAIRRPAETVGVAWEPGLVQQIIEDVAEAPGTLPLLQYALTQVFAARAGDVVTLDDYHVAGGVLGALGSHADEVFEGLDRAEREVARNLFLRLVAIQPSGEQTRRRARLVDLKPVTHDSSVAAVLGAFGDARLLTFDRDPVTRGPTVEVAHEAMLTRWPRLAEWIEATKEDLLLHQRLADAVTEWEESGRDDSYLLTRGRSEQFESWAGGTDFALTEGERQYLNFSRERVEEERRRRRKRRRLVMSGFAIAAIVASVLGVLAWIGRQDAAANAVLAHSRELTASATSVLGDDPELSVLLAIEALTASEPSVGSLAALHRSLSSDRRILTYTWPRDQVLGQDLSALLSPDGQLLVASSGGTYVEVVDVDSGDTLWGRDLGGDGITRATFTPDGSEVVVTYGWAYTDSERKAGPETASALGVHVFDAHTGDELRYLPVGSRCGVITRIYTLSTVDDGTNSYVVAEPGNDSNCNQRGETRPGSTPLDRRPPAPSIIDMATGEGTPLSDFRGLVGDPPPAMISSNGKVIARLDDQPDVPTTRVYIRESGKKIAEVPGSLMGVSGDGSFILTVDWPKRLIWDIRSGQPDSPLAELSNDPELGLLTLSADGSTAAETSDSWVTVFDAQTGDEVDRLVTGLGSNGVVSLSDDGTRVLVNEIGGRTAAVFDLDAPAELGAVHLCDQVNGDLSPMASPAGQIAVQDRCAPQGFPERQLIIDSETLAMTTVSTSAGSFGGTSAFSPDGKIYAEQTRDSDGFFESVVIRDARTGELTATLPGLCRHLEGSGNDCREYPDTPFPAEVLDLAFSPDGQLLASTGLFVDGMIIWDVTTDRILAKPQVDHLTSVSLQGRSVEFAPNGERLAASFGVGPPELWLLSTDDWKPIAHYQAPAGSSAGAAPTDNLLFTPDGETLIGTDAPFEGTGRIVFLDGGTLDPIYEIPDAHDGTITQLALSDDGTLLASAGKDGFVRVWNVESHSLIHEIPVAGTQGGVGGVTFVGPDHLAVVDNSTSTLQLLTMDTGELLDLARTRVTRGLTSTECTTYRIDPCPTYEEIRSG